MKFTVTWHPNAERELTEIWLSGRDRARITEACEKIEADLRSNPEQTGESRAEGDRIHFVAPIAVVFRVLADDLRIVVTRVWRY